MMPWRHDRCVLLQVEEDDDNIAPEQTAEGFQFDPNTQIPSEGFKF